VTPYYDRDGITIYHGDCLDVLPTLAPVDHVITDPPYAIMVVHTSRAATAGYGKAAALEYDGITATIRGAVAQEIGRLVRRWALVFCDAESLTDWRVALDASGLRHMRSGAWVSPACTPQFTGDRPGTGWEACTIAHAPGRSRWNGGGRPAVWIINRPGSGSEERAAAGHPTPKPSALLDQIVADFTDAGDLILDPFMGSGTTLVAAKRLGRRAIGIEREERYCAAAVRRLAQDALPLIAADGPPRQVDLGGDDDRLNR
jgi:hypothetical protein